MADRYAKIVSSDGGLRTMKRTLEEIGAYSPDAFETVEQLYGMLYYLANQMADEKDAEKVPDIIAEARESYQLGLAMSPTDRYQDMEV